jgi:hypothetical protein
MLNGNYYECIDYIKGGFATLEVNIRYAKWTYQLPPADEGPARLTHVTGGTTGPRFETRTTRIYELI